MEKHKYKNFKDKQAIDWILKVSGREKRNVVFLMLIQVFLGISSVIEAWMLRDVIDAAAMRQTDAFVRKSIIFAGLIILQIISRTVKRFLDEYTKSGLENVFKERLFSTLLNRDYARVTAVHSGEWMNRLTSDTVVVADGITTIFPDLFGMFVRLAGAMAAILLLIPKLGYALIPGGVLLLLVSWIFRKKSKHLHKNVQEIDGKLRVLLSERLSGLLIVKSFAKERQTVLEAGRQMKMHRKIRIKKNHFSNLCNTGFALVMNGVYVAGVIYAGVGLLKGTMSVGSFTAILQLIRQVQSPFANITGYLPKFYAMLASAERLMEAEEFESTLMQDVLDMEAVQKYYENDFSAMGLTNAAFTYLPPVQEEESLKNHMPVVLSEVNLEIKKGDYVAFTGHSGCGKSTILKLLMSLYHLDEGQCYVTRADGTKEILNERYIRLFAYVPQGNQLMSGSIREMVAFSDPDKMKDDALIHRSLEIACAAEVIDALPKGLDTVLGERGAGLSEGQMQRIAIARAICSGNPILVLDESTSALDDDTEQRLLENLKAMTDRTVLIVTHRPAVLQICNRHVVMNEEGIEVKLYGNKCDRADTDLSVKLRGE